MPHERSMFGPIRAADRHDLRGLLLVLLIFCAVLALLTIAGCEDARRTGATTADPSPRVIAPEADPVARELTGPSAARGKYIVEVGGCNDCHTPEFAPRNGDVPESQWLTGVPVGFKGPWGTTYPSNLRLFFKDMPEDLWVQVARSRNARPPMVWPSLHAMTDDDLRSVHRYVRSLPVTGEPMPAFVPAGVEPKTPYFEMVPQMPKGEGDAK